MKRQFSVKGLEVLTGTVRERRALVRQIHDGYTQKLAGLETRKKDFSPQYYERQKVKIKEDSLAALHPGG